MHLIEYTFLIIGILACQALGWPDPEPMEGTIPHNDREITMDPAMIQCKSDNKLFLFTTGKHKGEGYMWTSMDIKGPWTKTKELVFPDGEAWNAPYVHSLDDKYYMYYSNNLFNYSLAGVTDPEAQQYYHGSSIFVRSSDTMEPGSWKEHGHLDIPWSSMYNVLDGSLLTVGDDREGVRGHLLTFGSYQEGVFQIQLADPPVAVTLGGLNKRTNAVSNKTEATDHLNAVEAGFIYQYRDYYYLFFSSGRATREKDDKWADAGDAYKIMVCRSQNPRLHWVDKEGKNCRKGGGTMILGSHGNVWAPGGQGVIDDINRPEYAIIYYHYGKCRHGYSPATIVTPFSTF